MASLFAKLNLSKGSLTGRTVNAASWNLGRTGVEFVFRLGSNLIMTRLLMPEAFGILAFAMTFATAVALLTDIGIYQSIVREKDMMGPRFLRVLWTIKIIRSCVIALGVLAFAGLFSLIGPSLGTAESVMAAPEMPLLIALTALVPFGEGLVATNWEAAQRRMDYKRLVILEIAVMVLRILCQISAALISPTVWALLIGTFVAGFFKALFSHIFLPGPKMRLKWDRALSDRLWRYGKWIIGSSTMTFLVSNTDKLVFGALISSVTMGLYAIAFIWIKAMERVVSIFSNFIGFSLTSEILRDRPDEAPRLLRKYQLGMDILCVLAFGALFAGGPALVTLLYTDDYLGAGGIIQLLAPLMLSVRYIQSNNLLLAQGDSQAMFINTTIIAMATVPCLLIGFHFFGFEGGITGLVIARFASVPYLLRKTAPFFGRRGTTYDAAFGVCAVIAAGAVYFLSQPV